MPYSDKVQAKLLSLAQLLLLIATLLSGWLAVQALGESSITGCSAGSSCDIVLQSLWSSVFGIPISLIGLPLYLTLLILSRCAPSRHLIISTLAMTIIGGALWFTGLQAVIIQSYCPFCCTIHALASIASLILLMRVALQATTPPAIIQPMIISMSLVTLLAVAQYFGPQPVRSQTISLANHDHTPDDSHQHPILLEEQLTDFPLLQLGPSTESTPLAYLFDWTCDHCRSLHHTLSHLETSESYQIRLLPHGFTTEALDLHHVMLTAYYHFPEQYELLAELLTDGSLSPSEANDMAIELIGEDAWLPAIETQAPLTKQLLHTAQSYYQNNKEQTGIEPLPQLFSKYSLLSGSPTLSELQTFLTQASTEL